jgi:UPF0755 protein
MKSLLKLLTFALVFGAIAGFGLWQYGINYFNAPGILSQEKKVFFPSGTSARNVVKILGDEGVIAEPDLFLFITKILQREQKTSFKAGQYAFAAQISPRDVFRKLVEGDVVIYKATIPEGLAVNQIMPILQNLEGLEGEIPSEIAEGSLLPETYHYNYHDSYASLIQQMQQRMNQTLEGLWEKRAPDLPFTTKEEAVTLASIVEKETGVPEERGKIAAVFVNRLRKNMRLQSDPTVIYAITGGKPPLDRPLTREDLKMESPFNTYVTAGIPPHPIASPGVDALAAVLNPPASEDYYFVATGNGGHHFAATLKEHNANVTAYKKVLKESGQSMGD